MASFAAISDCKSPGIGTWQMHRAFRRKERLQWHECNWVSSLRTCGLAGAVLRSPSIERQPACIGAAPVLVTPGQSRLFVGCVHLMGWFSYPWRIPARCGRMRDHGSMDHVPMAGDDLSTVVVCLRLDIGILSGFAMSAGHTNDGRASTLARCSGSTNVCMCVHVCKCRRWFEGKAANQELQPSRRQLQGLACMRTRSRRSGLCHFRALPKRVPSQLSTGVRFTELRAARRQRGVRLRGC